MSFPLGLPPIFKPYQFTNVAAMGGVVTLPPSLPAFSNVVAAYGLNNFNPVGYSIGNCIGLDNDNYAFTAVAPFPLDYGTLITGTDVPPYQMYFWADQNQANDLIQSASARPTLQITSSVLVSGAGTAAANGTYTYRGQANGKGFYNLLGQPDSTDVSVIKWDSGFWSIINSAGDATYESESETSFPWQVIAWALNAGDSPAPTVTQIGPGTGQVEFNGTATGLQSSIALYGSGSATGTIYGWIQPESLSETGVIFETGTFADRANTIKQISIRMVAGVLTATIFDQTAITALPNMKVKTLSATDPIFITFQWDTAIATASLQTTLLVNDSATGVSSAAAADLSGLLIGGAKVNVGARNNAASAFLTANMWMLLAKSVVDSSTVRAQWFAYQQYLKSLQ